MKKTILGISFLLMVAFAGSANAQCQSENCPDKDNCKKEQCSKENCSKENCSNSECPETSCDLKDCNKDNCRDAKSKKARKGPYCKIPSPRNASAENCGEKGSCVKERIMADLNLTEEQKVKIKDIDKAMKESRKEVFTEMRKAEKSLSREEIAEKEKALKTKYLEDMKKILSGDQYHKFLENFFINQSPSHPTMKAHGRIAKKGDNAEFKKVEKEKTVVEKKKAKK